MRNLLHKIHSVNQVKTGVVLSYSQTIVTTLSGLLYTPYMLRCIGQADYGLFSLVSTFLGYFLLDFGLGNTVIRYVARYRATGDKKGEENFLAICFILYCVIDLLILAAIFTCYFFIGQIFGKSFAPDELQKFRIMYIITGGMAILSFPFNPIGGAISGYEQFAFPKLMQVISQILRLIVMVILLSMGYKVIAMVICNAVVGLVFLVTQLFYGFKVLKIRLRLHNFDKTLLRELFGYSFFVFIGIIADMLYWKIGPTILGAVNGAKDVAVFSIGMILVTFYLTFSTAISNVFVPRVTTMITKNASPQELTDLMIRIGRIQFIILGVLLCGIIALGKQFIVLWAGDNYIASYYITCILIIPLTLPLTQNIGISILYAQNRHAFRAIMLLCVSIVNVIISYFFIKAYGSIGASIGTALSLILGQGIIINVYYYQKINLEMVRFFKECILGLLFPIALSILVGYLLGYLLPSNTVLTFMPKAIAFLAAYISIMWFIGMNKYEKNLFGTPVLKLFKGRAA